MLNPCNLGHFITRASLQYVVCILLPWDPQHAAPIVQTLPTWRITPVAKCHSEHLKFTWKLRTTFRMIHVRPSWEDFCSEIHLLGNLIGTQNNDLKIFVLLVGPTYRSGIHKALRPSEPNPLGGILPGDTMMSSAWQQSFWPNRHDIHGMLMADSPNSKICPKNRIPSSFK